MRLLLNARSRDRFAGALEAITSIDQRQWGSLTPERLMAHLRLAFEASLGEHPEIRDESKPVLRTLMRYVFFEWFTRWPGGKIHVPDSFTPPPEGELEQERQAVIAAMDRFLDAAGCEPERRETHMMMGPLPLRVWRRIHAVHMRHHFRQYGVDGRLD